MFYALFRSNRLIGIFDSKDSVDNMIEGIVQNKFCDRNNLLIKEFKKNSIVKVDSNKLNNNSEEINNKLEKEEIKLSREEERKRNKEKSEIEYEITKLKKDREIIEESKKTYKVDLDLYERFKKIKQDNNSFEIPELFSEKYRVFEMLDSDGNLNWENFYANYKHKNLSSDYSQMFH
jgi:hypothetical protein